MLAPISWRVPPRRYGPWEQFTSLLTEGLVGRGVDVTLFATPDSVTAARLVARANTRRVCWKRDTVDARAVSLFVGKATASLALPGALADSGALFVQELEKWRAFSSEGGVSLIAPAPYLVRRPVMPRFAVKSQPKA